MDIKDIWISTHNICIGTFVSEYVGNVIVNSEYDIPSVVSKLTDEQIRIMSKFNILNVYCVEDSTGIIHMNGDDIKRIVHFTETANDGRELRQRNWSHLNLIVIDYKTPEEVKETFWKSIL